MQTIILGNLSDNTETLDERMAYLIILITWSQLSSGEKKDLKDNLQTLSIKLENHQDEFFKMAIKAISEIENSDSSPWVQWLQLKITSL